MKSKEKMLDWRYSLARYFLISMENIFGLILGIIDKIKNINIILFMDNMKYESY